MQRVKKECWQKFLERKEELDKLDRTKIQSKDKNQCWKALQYTKPKRNHTTPAFKDPNNEIAVTIQNKEVLVRTPAFLKSLLFYKSKYQST